MKKISSKLLILGLLLILFSFRPPAVLAHCLDGDSPCPIANYPFREGSGIFTDGIAKNGSVVFGLRSQLNNVSWTGGISTGGFDPSSGKFALSFNGQNSYVQMPDNPVFNLKDKVTLKFRLKLRSLPTGNSVDIVGKRPSYWFEIYKDGSCHFWINRTGDGGQAISSFGGCLDPNYDLNRWIEFKGVYDGTKAHLFKDGVGRGSKTFSSSQPLVQSTTPLTLGARKPLDGGYGGSFNGDLDYVEIYNTPFNPLKGDITHNDIVDYQDMIALLKTWHQTPPPMPIELETDLDKNYVADSRDFAILTGLIKWDITSPR